MQSLSLILLTSLLLGADSCSPEAPKPSFTAPIYATDSRTKQVFVKVGVDADGNDIYEQCVADQPCFDSFVCSKIDDYSRGKQALIDLSYQCKEWKK